MHSAAFSLAHSADRHHRNRHAAANLDRAARRPAARPSLASTACRTPAQKKCNSRPRSPLRALPPNCGTKRPPKIPPQRSPLLHQRTTSRALSDSRPRCTPAARAASATSNRSFTITRVLPHPATASRATASNSRPHKSFSRTCTQSTPAAAAARILPSTPAPPSPTPSDFRSVT